MNAFAEASELILHQEEEAEENVFDRRRVGRASLVDLEEVLVECQLVVEELEF